MALADITGERIQQAFMDDPNGKRFEEFLRRLLEKEMELRHHPTARIEGPGKTGSSDGGCDLVFRVVETPKCQAREFFYALTPDEGAAYYSCKTGVHWKKHVMGDVGHGEFLNTDPPGDPARSIHEPPREVLELLSAGGRYVVIVSTPVGNSRKILDKIAIALSYWLAASGHAVPAGLRDQLSFWSGNELASFVRHHRPTLPTELSAKLSMVVPDRLRTWDEWTDQLGADGREPVVFEPDEQRNDVIEAVRAPAGGRIIRVFGPPGVGKTRVVRHALESQDVSAVFYTDDALYGHDVADGSWLRDAGAVTLVVDEVTSDDADGIASRFASKTKHSNSGARLILIGITDGAPSELERRATPGGMVPFHLERLAPEASRRLVEREIVGPSTIREQQIAAVLELAEGYPLFAILLARALNADEEVLARGDDEASRWEAAIRVLVGPLGHMSQEDRRKKAELRAKCLLVVLMTGDLDLPWDELWRQFGAELCEAIDEPGSWHEVKREEKPCREREILRRVGTSNRRYISPANLARMIMIHFLTPPDPTDDLGPRIARYAPRFLARLQHQAARFGTQEVRRKLLSSLWDELERRTAVGEPLDALVSQSVLEAAAQQAPERAALAIADAIVHLDERELRVAAAVRRAAKSALEHVVHRSITRTAFEHAEHALFRMAGMEDDPWPNNATGIWKSLFLVTLSQTHQPWSLRLALLRHRCRRGSAAERLLAMEGLAIAVSWPETSMGHHPEDAVDGAWPRPTAMERAQHKCEAWELLLESCEGSDDPATTRARELVALRLREGLRSGVGAALVGSLAGLVHGWSAQQRRALSEALADARRSNAESTTLAAATHDALERLEAALQPRRFEERLVDQVGSWQPGPWSIGDAERSERERELDEVLVAEALRDHALLLERLEWLSTDRAVRRRPFLRALGRLDRERVFLPHLEAFALAGPGASVSLLASYVEGWASADERAHVDAWIAEQIVDEAHDRVLAVVLPLLPPSDARLAWLVELVRRGASEPGAHSALRRSWVGQTSSGLMVELLTALAERREGAHIGVSLVYELLQRPLEPLLRERVIALGAGFLTQATLSRMPSSYEFDWERLARELAAAGRLREVLAGVFALLESAPRSGNSSLGHRVLASLLTSGHGRQIWEAASSHLGGHEGHFVVWTLARVDITSHVDPGTILAWVGEDRARGAMVAEMVNLHRAELPAVARGLLIRFGADDEVAWMLSGRVMSRPWAELELDSMSFARKQLENALRWAHDEDPRVRQWATDVSERLKRSIEEMETPHELDRKYA
jgi:RecA/RadA recombinase